MKNLTATICLTLAVLLGSAGMSESADYQKGLTAYKVKDYATALREWKPLAIQGHAHAQGNLGVMYNNGRGVPRDYKTALKWYRLAAEQGNASAQFNLGSVFENGEGVRKNKTTAVKWYRLAAKQGHAHAQFNLGVLYHMGRDVTRDYKTALKWYTLAAEQGDADGQYYVGWMYANGKGVPKNNKTAVKWYTLSAEQGQRRASINLKIAKKEAIKEKKLEQKIRSNSRISKIRANENLKDNYGFKELRLGMSIKDIKNIKECRIKRHYPVQGQVRTTSLIHCYKKEISINLFGDYLEKITLPMGFLAGMPTTKIIGGVVELGDWEKIRNILSKKYKENFTFLNRDIDLFNRTNKRLYTVFESGAVALEIYKKKVQYVPQPHFKVVYRGRETAKKFFNSVKPQAELKAKDF